jgi:group I intron endonuclease
MEYTIYKIYCKDENVKDCYVGSTKDFNKRIIKHKSICKKSDRLLYNFIRNNGGFNNFNIEIIETLICENKNEALTRERFWIEELKSNLNKVIPSRTFKEYMINYIENNNTIITEQRKKYYEENKNLIIEKNKQYYVNNKEIILQKCLCICGNYYTKKHKARHEKSKKHQDYLSPLPNGL